MPYVLVGLETLYEITKMFDTSVGQKEANVSIVFQYFNISSYIEILPIPFLVDFEQTLSTSFLSDGTTTRLSLRLLVEALSLSHTDRWVTNILFP